MASGSSTSSMRKEVMGLHRITKKALLDLCKRDSLFQTPRLNDVLYLHYQGFQYIECLEEYTDLKCLWLDCNAISEIQGLEQQTKLKCLFLQSNLIKRIENLGCCVELDTLNLSMNHIRKIENIGSDVLPVLNTLNIASNYLKDSESLAELVNCKQLSVLDLSNNRIDDILIVKIFEQMPNLHVLVLQGNPVVSRLPQYRKTLTLACKELTYLDSRPVFPRDRACAEAWKRGGYEEERRENNRWNRMDRQKIRDSVNSTIRLRNKHRPSDKQEPLINSTDSEEEAEANERARSNRVRAEIENGSVNDIWKEVIENSTDEPPALQLDDGSSSTSAGNTSDSSGETSLHSKDSLIAEQMSSRKTLTEGIKRKENVLDVAECGNLESILKLTKETAPKILEEEAPVHKVLIEEITTSNENSIHEARDLGKLIPIEEVTFAQNATLEIEPNNKLIVGTADIPSDLIQNAVGKNVCDEMTAEISTSEANVSKMVLIEDITRTENIKLETEVECNDIRNEPSDLVDTAVKPILIEELGIVESKDDLADVVNVKENIMLERNFNVDEAVIKGMVTLDKSVTLRPATKLHLLDDVIEQTNELRPAKKLLIEEIQSGTSSDDEEEYEKTRKVLADLSRNDDLPKPEEDETKQSSLKHIDKFYEQIKQEPELSQPLEELLNEPSDYVTFKHDFDNVPEPFEPNKSDVEPTVTAKTVNEMQYEKDCAAANERVTSEMQALLKNMDSRIGELLILENLEDSNETASNVSSLNSQVEEQFSEPVVMSARKSSRMLIDPCRTEVVDEWKAQSELQDLNIENVTDANVNSLFKQAKQFFDESYNGDRNISLLSKEKVMELKLLVNQTLELVDSSDSEMYTELVKEDEVLQTIIEQLEALEAEKQKDDIMRKQNVFECDNLSTRQLVNNTLVGADELSKSVFTFREETMIPESETNVTLKESKELNPREVLASQNNMEPQLREHVISVDPPEANEVNTSVNDSKLEFTEESVSRVAWDIVDTEANLDQQAPIETNSEIDNVVNDDTNFRGNNSLGLPLTDDEKASLTTQNTIMTASELEANIIYEERRLQLNKADLELHQLLQECEDQIDELYNRNNDALNAMTGATGETTEDGSTVCTKLLDEMLDTLTVDVEKPRSHDFGVIESDEEYCYSDSRINETSKDDLGGGKSIRECMDAFDDFLCALDNSVQQRTLGVRKMKVPSTAEEKIKSAEALLQAPNLAELNRDSQDDINNQIAEMEEKRKRHVQRLTERCYAQRDKYDDTLEVVDGRLVVVNKDTGEISDLPSPPGYSYSDEEEFGSKSLTSEDYDTADEAQGAMQATNTRGMWTKPYKPTARKSAEHLITAALQRHAQATNEDDEDKSVEDEETEPEDDQFYSLDNNATGVFGNIDAEFFRKLNLDELHAAADDEHLVACARSYNELKRCLKRSREELRLTAEENDLLKCMLPLNCGAGGDNQTEDERLLQKLVERTRAQEVREKKAYEFEQMLDLRPSCSKQNTWPAMGHHLVRGAAELYDDTGEQSIQPASQDEEVEKTKSEQAERSAISDSSDLSDEEESTVPEENYNAEGSGDEEDEKYSDCFKAKVNISPEAENEAELVTMIAPPNLPENYLFRSEMDTEEIESGHQEFSLREYCRREYEQREHTDDESIAAFRRSLLRPTFKNYLSDDDDAEVGHKRTLLEKHETVDRLPESLEKRQKLMQAIKCRLYASETSKDDEPNASVSEDYDGAATTTTEMLASDFGETADITGKYDEEDIVADANAEEIDGQQADGDNKEANAAELITNASLSYDEDEARDEACAGLNIANQINLGNGMETVEDVDVEVLDSCTEIYFKRTEVSSAEMAEGTEHVLMVKPAWLEENFAATPVVDVVSNDKVADVDCGTTVVSVEEPAMDIPQCQVVQLKPYAATKDELEPIEDEATNVSDDDNATNEPQEIECNLEILNDDGEIIDEITVNANVVYKF